MEKTKTEAFPNIIVYCCNHNLFGVLLIYWNCLDNKKVVY